MVRPMAVYKRFINGSAALILALAAGCGEKTSPPQPTSPARTTDDSGQTGAAENAGQTGQTGAPAASTTGATPAVALADEPRIDLVHNRFLWHLAPAGQAPQDAGGVFVPVAAEGLRKYTQEYNNPWQQVIEVDGKPGRVLAARAATLRIPWSAQGGGAVVRMRVRGGTTGQKLSLDINGKRVANAGLEPGWQVASFDVGAGVLRAGENELRLFMGKRGGPDSAYALIHSIDIAPAPASKSDSKGDSASDSGGAAAATAWPPLSPARAVTVAGQPMPALTGFARMTLYVEVPEQAWLRVHTGTPGDARFRILARAFDTEPAVLLDHTGKAGQWQQHTISLAALAGRLVELTFIAPPDAAWGTPRIALQEAPTRPRPAPYDNAILLVVDALRSDRLTLYGDTRVQTPNITKDGRARGVVFHNNQAASPSSPPSHGSIQTGMIPRVHGVSGDKAQLTPGTPMISTQLVDAGISAAYYGNNPFGMARLEKPGRWTAFHQTNQEGKGIDCTALMDEMLGFADSQAKAGKRFFISSLPYETHTPYRYHEGITDKYHPGPWGPPVGKNVDGVLLGQLSAGKVTLDDAQWAQLKALYDGEAEHMDGCYAQLLSGLEARGLRQRTLVVLTSDHGEGMYEHGKMGHAFGHHAELANVPLVLMGDGLVDEGIVIDTVTSHLDIVPTILDLMGVPASERIQGQSLVPLLLRQGPWTPRVMPLEYGRSYALRARRWKYIVDYQGNESVFDLQNDPTEQQDLIGKNPMALRYLRDLAGFFLAHRSDWRMSELGALNNHGPGFLRHVDAKPL